MKIKSNSMVEEKRKKKYLKYVGLVKGTPAVSGRVGQMNYRHEKKKKEIMDKYLHKVQTLGNKRKRASLLPNIQPTSNREKLQRMVPRQH